jgi:xanthine dehydrogenase/oxidase
MKSHEKPDELCFYLNGRRVVVRDVDPRTLLLDYLRSDEVGLTGTKKVCAQGGCGACTVTLHRWNERTQAVENLAVNSCLRPLCSLDGMAVTTVEGVGSVETALSPVQNEIATNAGTQCGYCTPGWVMSMHSYLVEHPDAKLDQKGVEDLFDGNLCRCTGYRPILFAMRHFASDFTTKDEEGCLKCLVPPNLQPRVAAKEPNQVPGEIARPGRPLSLAHDGYRWLRPVTLAGLLELLDAHGSVDDLRLVAGNTSIGIYGEPAQGVTMGPPHIRVDISQVPELHALSVDAAGLTVGAATTYTELLAALDALPEAQRDAIAPIRYMAGRTAGRIVRDAATLGGNTMLVVQHVREGVPFPSDMFTALEAMGATVDVLCPRWPSPQRLTLLDFAARWQDDPELQAKGVLLAYHLPFTGPGEWARTFKVALREVNAHSIVNGGFRVALDERCVVRSCSAVLGGIGPVAFRLEELEAQLVGRPWDADTLATGLELVQRAARARLAATEARMRDVPDEGFTDAYRVHLAETFFYQFFVWVAEQVVPGTVSREVRSAGERPVRPYSRGTQRFQQYQEEFPVSFPFVKIEAFMQVTGQARYTQDQPLPSRGVDGAFVISTRPLARFAFAVPEGETGKEALSRHLAERFPGFLALVTADDIPGQNNQQYSGPDDPLLCVSQVTACGQPLALVLASERQLAIDIAWWVQTYAVAYQPVLDAQGAPVAPVLRLDEALKREDLILEKSGNIMSLTRPSSTFEWMKEGDEAVVDGVHCRIVHGEQESRSPQIHFYMETQAAIAIPGERGAMTVLASTQNPNTILGAVKGALKLPSNLVNVEIPRLGGGYGGKGPRSPWAAANAAVAAQRHGRPVRINVPRQIDSAMFGHSSPLLGRYVAAIGTGKDNPNNRGRLMGLHTDFFLDAGNTADCSPIVLDCVQLRSDNAYLIPNYETTGKACLTNTISNTSFRSLEAVSGILIQEDAVEAAAHAIGVRPEEIRERNLYRLGDATPFGQVLEECYMADVWRYAKGASTNKSPAATPSFAERAAAVDAWNLQHRWRKRGISMIPVKYGMGFNLASMERGDALVDIYTDGGVLVRHGGVEMGQGLNTQVTQLVALALNVPQDLIQVGTTSTAVIPNPTSSGASTGPAFNGGAAREACQRLRKRLEAFCMTMLNQHGRDYCTSHHLDYWNHDKGWQAEVVVTGTDAAGQPTTTKQLMWPFVISAANTARVNLSTQAQHDETGGSGTDVGIKGWDPTKPPPLDQYFVGYTFSVGISEVELDVLTGEVTILRSDLVYDMGKSLNPATDIGQVEGAFLQGVGRVLTEEIVTQPREPGLGLNNTPNTWGYKVPAITTVPLELNVDLYPREDASEVPENPHLLMSAKESGEPPLCLATTVYFALKHAILAARRDRGHDEWFRLDLPCSVQRVREACLVERDDLKLGRGEARPAG